MAIPERKGWKSHICTNIYIYIVVVGVCCCDFRLGKFPKKIFQSVKATGAL